MRYLCSLLVFFWANFRTMITKKLNFLLFSVNLKKNYPKFWEVSILKNWKKKPCSPPWMVRDLEHSLWCGLRRLEFTIWTLILIEIGLTYPFLFTSPNNFDGVVVCLEWAIFIGPSLNKMHSQKIWGKIKVLLKTLLRKMLGTWGTP